MFSWYSEWFLGRCFFVVGILARESDLRHRKIICSIGPHAETLRHREGKMAIGNVKRIVSFEV